MTSGGGLAPYAAGRLVLALNIHVPFFIAAGVVAIGIVILTTVHQLLAEAERAQAEQVSEAGSATPTEWIIPVPGHRGDEAVGVIVAAVDDSPVAALADQLGPFPSLVRIMVLPKQKEIGCRSSSSPPSCRWPSTGTRSSPR